MNNMNKEPVAGESAENQYPLYPNHLFVEGVVAMMVLLIIVLISFNWHVPLEEMADPGDTTYVPRPEWYFLFYFQLLKYFGGSLVVVGTFVLPVVLFGALVLLPFFDKGESTSIRKRPWISASGLVGVVAIVGLTWLSVVEDTGHASQAKMDLPPITQESVAAGKEIFEKYCLLCHQIDGKGGFMAPDLTQVGARRNRASIEQVIITPKIVSQTTIMSEIPLSDDERHDVSAYLSQKKK